MKKTLIIICSILMVLLTGCTTTSYEFTGEFVDVSGTDKASYHKDYIMMDCCDEWNDIIKYSTKIYYENPCIGIEIFEFYVYDKKGNEIEGINRTVTYHPTEFFSNLNYESITVYDFNTKESIQAEIIGTDVVFHTDKNGIFLAVKHGVSDEKPWICNPTSCNNKCSTCSEE